MAAIRVPKQLAGGTGRLILNPPGTLVGVFVENWTGGTNHELTVYSTADGKCVGGPLALGDCRGAEFLTDDTLLFTSGNRLLRWCPPQEPDVFTEIEGTFYALAVCPARDRIGYAFASREYGAIGYSRAAVADPATGQPLWTAYPLFSDLSIHRVAFSSGGRFLAVQLNEPRNNEYVGLMLCDTLTGRRVQTYCPMWSAEGLGFAPDESWFVAVSRGPNSELDVYELTSADSVRSIPLPPGVPYATDLRLTPDGTRLQVVGYTGAWAVVDPVTGAVHEQHDPPHEIETDCGVAVSANGRVAAGVTTEGTVAVWPLAGGKKPARKKKS